jgi:predicted GNAT family N-acyltransferase
MIIRIAENESDVETCFRLRREVFVVEQSVPIGMERDEYDSGAIHFLAKKDGQSVAAARVVLKDQGATAKIGRVAVLKSERGSGVGKLLMQAVETNPRLAEVKNFILDAQTYALRFYENLGYEAYGDEFLDAGIPHRHMSKRRPEST